MKLKSMYEAQQKTCRILKKKCFGGNCKQKPNTECDSASLPCGEGMYGFAPPNESLLAGAALYSTGNGGEFPALMILIGLALLDFLTMPDLKGINLTLITKINLVYMH